MLKQVVKLIARIVAILVVLPMVVAFSIQKSVAFQSYTQLLSLMPGTVGVYLRWAFLRLVIPHCGPDAFVGFATVFSHATVVLGRRSYLGVGCMVGDVTIGDDALIGSHVSIINGNRQHGIDRSDVPVREQPGEYPRVTIGVDAWIGDRAIVMANVGDHAVVGAGSVVTKSVQPHKIVAGNPARVIGERTSPSSVSDSQTDV